MTVLIQNYPGLIREQIDHLTEIVLANMLDAYDSVKGDSRNHLVVKVGACFKNDWVETVQFIREVMLRVAVNNFHPPIKDEPLKEMDESAVLQLLKRRAGLREGIKELQAYNHRMSDLGLDDLRVSIEDILVEMNNTKDALNKMFDGHEIKS